MRNVAVPVATGSPAGDSASPVSATGMATPPVVGVSTVFGQPPWGAGTMSAGFLSAAFSAAPETLTFLYGFAFDVVRAQIVFFAVVPATADVRPAPASARTASRKPKRF